MGAWSEREICQRGQEAEQSRLKVMPMIDEALAYSMPWRRQRANPRTDMDRLFDSTSLVAMPRWTGKLQAGVTPPFQRWFNLEAGALVPTPMIGDVNRMLELPTTLAHATLDFSSYHHAARECYADLAVGTGAVLLTEGTDQTLLHAEAAPAWALGIERGPSGMVENTYWLTPKPAWMLPRLWPQARWPKEIEDKISERRSDPVEVLQATYYDPEYRRWRLAIVVKSGGGDHAQVWESEHRTNPWIIPRYWTTPGDPWGRGPLTLALPDIRTANKTVEMVLTAAAFQLAPVLTVLHDGVVNPDTLRLGPRSIIRVGRTGGPMGKSIEPLDIGSRVDLAQIVLEDQRTAIKAHLHDSQLPPPLGAVRSASEIIERSKELAGDDGNAFVALNWEMVPPTVSRVLDILDRKKVPGIDFERMRPDQMTFKVTATGPLARAQALEDVQNTVQWTEVSKAIGGDELFAHGAVVEEIIPYLGRKMGVSPRLVRTAMERDQIEKAAGAVAGQALAAQAVPAGGGAQPAPFATPQASPLTLTPANAA